MVDTRNLNRDSLFLTAILRADAAGEGTRVKVRNLSDGGMMAEGELLVSRGDRIVVELRNTRPVRGTVAWTQGSRIGIAFDDTVDARAVRNAPAPSFAEAPRHSRPAGRFSSYSDGLRKI